MLEGLKEMFRKPSALTLAVRELEDAKRHILEHMSAEEYHRSMVDYYSSKITRLEIYVKGDDRGEN